MSDSKLVSMFYRWMGKKVREHASDEQIGRLMAACSDPCLMREVSSTYGVEVPALDDPRYQEMLDHYERLRQAVGPA